MRIDSFLFINNIFNSRTKALQAIERGEIFIEGKKIIKPSFNIDDHFDINKISWIKEKSFVSLGGYKLEKGLIDFNFNVKDLVAVDLGASTGGFTDCLIKREIKKVYAVDLNDDLLDKSLRENKRVIPLIKNARQLLKEDFIDKIDLVVADLSFISETIILPVIKNILKINGYAIILIKPQFESEIKIKNKNGIVKDYKQRKLACKRVFNCAKEIGLTPISFTNAPIKSEKNNEYLLLLYNGIEKEFDLDLYNFEKNNFF